MEQDGMFYHLSILFQVITVTMEMGGVALEIGFCMTEFGLLCDKLFSLAIDIGLVIDGHLTIS